MKKKLAVLFCLVMIAALAGCASKLKTFAISGAEKLTVMSGSTGERIDITDADEIRYITDNICSLTFSRGGKVKSDGWRYGLQWFDKNGESLEKITVLSGHSIIYDGHYYKGSGIDLDFLDGLFTEG